MDSIKIDSLDELKRLSKDNFFECYITLNGVLSRKTITYYEVEKEFVIMNHIDDTQTNVEEKDIYDMSITNVGYAILKGALCYELEDNGDNTVLFPEEGDPSQSVFGESQPTLEEQAEYDRYMAAEIQRQMEEEANEKAFDEKVQEEYYKNNPYEGEGPLPQDNYNYNPEP